VIDQQQGNQAEGCNNYCAHDHSEFSSRMISIHGIGAAPSLLFRKEKSQPGLKFPKIHLPVWLAELWLDEKAALRVQGAIQGNSVGDPIPGTALASRGLRLRAGCETIERDSWVGREHE
jgi:hypothetical protein